MPSNRPATIRTDTLPEFLRSPAVGAIVAEALSAQVARGDVAPGALADMLAAAAEDIWTHHDIDPERARLRVKHQHAEHGTPERDMDEWTRTEPEADQG